MNGKNKESRYLVNQIREYIKKNYKGEDGSLIDLLAVWYFSSVSDVDLESKPIETWARILLFHWKLIAHRKPGDSKIRIINPDVKKDGWSSSRTAIFISHDDIPFLVDSIRMVLDKHDYEIYFILHFGGLKVARDKRHRITQILPFGTQQSEFSSAPIYIEIDRIVDEKVMKALQVEIEHSLQDVRAAVGDWRAMIAKLEDCLHELEAPAPGLDIHDVSESRLFLQWLLNNNFTFLGCRDYKLIGDGQNRALQSIPNSGLGVLRDNSNISSSKSYAELPPQARKMALSKNILIIAKTNTPSTIHRNVRPDYIGVKRYNKQGELIGERRFIGLYTSSAYHTSPRQIPFLRHKVDQVIHDFGFPHDSHDGKEVVHILETLPRDDLFQASHEELFELTRGILHLKERKKLRLLVRRDAFQRYFSCLVYMPRELFTTNLADKMRNVLMHAFNSNEATYDTYFSDSVLARVHYIVRVDAKNILEYDINSIESELASVARSWSDQLKDALLDRYDENTAVNYFIEYGKAFSAGYMEAYTPQDAVFDIDKIETLSKENPLTMRLYRLPKQTQFSLKIFQNDDTIILSDAVPILENMGLIIIAESSHQVKHHTNNTVWINDFTVVTSAHQMIDIEAQEEDFQTAFKQIWYGFSENDRFNRLVLEANLNWQQVAMLRAYAKYLRQIGFTLSQSYIEQALIHHTGIAQALAQLFDLRFNPKTTDKEHTGQLSLIKQIEHSLENVTSLDEDRIFRRLLELILATIRTNFYQSNENGLPKSYISYKFNPALISDLPLPRPKFEIFVYSPRVEGVHLRAGSVARGGLRWSDRKEDFRTEVLGLMKAQQVKNTVIVPEGAKGGFVVKLTQAPDMSRETYMSEVIACYTIFISGLLDITDNIHHHKVIPPKNVVRYDGDDPYLVVAADKGTATFSDIANSISKKYGYWLDDAFASGGSQGYDHKKMGITSRGVWVSVKRHFRELGINPETNEFTVIGVGDMSGDVFGNGMLLSRHTKLVGAYNGDHIFLDPYPDPEKSYEERKRLFQLPRSSWTDYDPKLISLGGGVFSRYAKSITLTTEIKKLLDVTDDVMVPNDLIKAMLRAPVDLIWNGGIGTFVKASYESHLDVGDRTNDNIRVNGNELRAKIIAEGGNLGLTQLARIEYSLNGGIVNTDFIDNSAGVDCSDHEVNIKILLNRFMLNGTMTLEERNKLLEKMTDEVASLVLLDNYEQTQMLSLEASVANQTLDIFRHYISELERAGKLDRKLEYLPDDKTIFERKASNRPLTRPEIAILLAYCKMYLKQTILATKIPEDPYFDKYLYTAFPEHLHEKYAQDLRRHPLRREIVATQLCKAITDRMGVNFVERLQRETGAMPEFIIRSFTVSEHIYDMQKIWAEIVALDDTVHPSVQYSMMLQVYYLIRRSTRWFIRNMKSNLNIEPVIKQFYEPIKLLCQLIPEVLDSRGKADFDNTILAFVAQNVPEPLAQQIATCTVLYTSLDIVEAAQKYKLDLNEVAETYYALGDKLELNWLREAMNFYTIENQWDELARAGFRDDLDRVQRKLSAKVLTMKTKEEKEKNINDRIELWVTRCQFFIKRWNELLTEMKSSDTLSFVTYSVVLRELFDFVSVA